MRLNLSKAAAAAGISRNTLYKHIQGGKVSVQQDERGKQFIDTTEIVRVYGEIHSKSVQDNPTVNTSSGGKKAGHVTAADSAHDSAQLAAVKADAERMVLESKIRELSAVLETKDAMIALLQQSNHDLRLMLPAPAPVQSSAPAPAMVPDHMEDYRPAGVRGQGSPMAPAPSRGCSRTTEADVRKEQKEIIQRLKSKKKGK